MPQFRQLRYHRCCRRGPNPEPGSTTSETSIAPFAEEELLKADRRAEAFNQYALLADQANTPLATFRALSKKYPRAGQGQAAGPPDCLHTK